MEGISPSFDPIGTTIAQNQPHNSSSPALTSPSIPAPPSPPRRQTISSASEMPQKDIKAAVFSQHVASQHYVEHHRKAIDSLRQQHREERAMWDIERQELLLKVAELEAKITRISHLNGSDIPSIADKLSKYSIGSSVGSRSASAPTNLAPANISKEHNLSPSTGSPPGSLSIDRFASKLPMDSIPEGIERTKSVAFVEGPTNEQLNKQLEGQCVPGELVDKNLDGVMIKASSLPVAVKKAILEDSHSATPSPLRSPSPIKSPETCPHTPQRPVTIEIPSTQSVLQLPSKELYTLAAGHTPLARVADLSDDDTGVSTPIAASSAAYTAEQEKPPLEPYPSKMDVKPLRPPNERGDSYFNVPVPEPTEGNDVSEREPLPPTSSWKEPQVVSTSEDAQILKTLDDDPALTGPLSLPSNPGANKIQNGSNGGDFLSKLDERLTSLSKEQDISKNPSISESNVNGQREGADPPLRIKRSLNFGSQWGMGNAGRDA